MECLPWILLLAWIGKVTYDEWALFQSDPVHYLIVALVCLIAGVIISYFMPLIMVLLGLASLTFVYQICEKITSWMPWYVTWIFFLIVLVVLCVFIHDFISNIISLALKDDVVGSWVKAGLVFFLLSWYLDKIPYINFISYMTKLWVNHIVP